jgi:ribosomal protein S9
MTAGDEMERPHAVPRTVPFCIADEHFLVCYKAVLMEATQHSNCSAEEDALYRAKTPTELRLTQDLLEGAGALIEVMAADPEVRALGMPTRTAVLRLAIARGLLELERQYRPQLPTDAPAPRSATTPHDRETEDDIIVSAPRRRSTGLS